MKTVAYADDRGRVTLGSKLVDEYGRKFAVVRHREEIILIPIPKDPIAHLQGLGREAGIDKYTTKELKEMAREEAEKEAMNNVRRHRLLAGSGKRQ